MKKRANIEIAALVVTKVQRDVAHKKYFIKINHFSFSKVCQVVLILDAGFRLHV